MTIADVLQGTRLVLFLALRGVRFEYLDPAAFGEREGTHIGMIAQEVEQVLPAWIDTDREGLKRLTFRGFEALTVEAVRELHSRTDQHLSELQARIDTLEAQNAELRALLAAVADHLESAGYRSK